MSFTLARFILTSGISTQAGSTARNHGSLLLTPRARKFTTTAIPLAQKVTFLHITPLLFLSNQTEKKKVGFF